MLSRDAEHLYWLSRYVERVENTARLVNVNSELMLDFPGDKTLGWKSIVRTLDNYDIYSRKYVTFKETNVLNFIAFEQANPSSINNCLVKAAYNIKETRDYLPASSIEQIHNLLNDFKSTKVKKKKVTSTELYRLIEGSQRFFGIINDNFTTGYPFEFIRMGRYVERADMISRILDTLCLSYRLDQTHDFKTLEWASMLRNLSAQEAFREQSKGEIERGSVLKFLVQNKTFPRSISTCLSQIENSVASLPNNKMMKNAVLKTINRSFAANIDRYDDMQLHDFLQNLQKKLCDLDERIHRSWFLLHS